MRIVVCILLLQLWLAGAVTAQQSDEKPNGNGTPPRIALRAPDAFYEAPAKVPAKPGVLLRSEALTDRALPNGARAWRMLYTTTLDDRARAVASAVVVAATDLPSGPRPVISWAHGTVGITPACAPSLASTPVAGVPALDQVIALGWVLVATDYTGLGTQGPHPYIIGEGEARSALDAVRAAKQIPELTLEPRAIVWGHSQGGHAALWQGIIAPRYAPDVNVIAVVASAPPSDPAAMVASHAGTAAGVLLESYLATAYSDVYPDVEFDKVVRPEAHDIARQAARVCARQEMASAQALLKQVDGVHVLIHPPGAALSARLDENAPFEPIALPLLIVQGLSDVVVPVAMQDRFVAERCAGGQSLEYWTFAGLDHATMTAPDSPLGPKLIRWTEDRLADIPRASGCVRKRIKGHAR